MDQKPRPFSNPRRTSIITTWRLVSQYQRHIQLALFISLPQQRKKKPEERGGLDQLCSTREFPFFMNLCDDSLLSTATRFAVQATVAVQD